MELPNCRLCFRKKKNHHHQPILHDHRFWNNLGTIRIDAKTWIVRCLQYVAGGERFELIAVSFSKKLNGTSLCPARKDRQEHSFYSCFFLGGLGGRKFPASFLPIDLVFQRQEFALASTSPHLIHFANERGNDLFSNLG